MRIGSIRPNSGATRPSKRRGKGSATGLGGTSGRGHKGHKVCTGGKIPSWFEGGQMPIQRRLPKRGFKNPGHVEFQVVNLSRLTAVAANTTIDRAWLKSQRIIRRPGPIKLLGSADLNSPLNFVVDAASQTARAAVEKAGGRIDSPRKKDGV
jgi:large subunit ribosomal protein L15